MKEVISAIAIPLLAFLLIRGIFAKYGFSYPYSLLILLGAYFLKEKKEDPIFGFLFFWVVQIVCFPSLPNILRGI